ncbi:hypothetical protein DBZ36_19865 [Alginatibacterium sediminis]|uniref:Uncharacterized protein n=1 Tax=Alginatibacterium sediminis TaxID=2164068 RepID=A0A420E6N3_9ALTE|nr:hypothetical protein [Alginatibacterium sediminis]RKF13317.1 hypothetical protein DBZ36_19865 [Alginatibacterium sediminis]
MEQVTQRYIRVGQWLFEVKSVRAIRVSEYGQPYDACCNMSFNGDQAYIDNQLTRNDAPFTQRDFSEFYQFLQTMGVSDANYDRYQHGQRRNKQVKIINNADNETTLVPFTQRETA